MNRNEWPAALSSFALFKIFWGREGRPSVLPFAFALARPAMTLSLMMSFSNSATAPTIWKTSLPVGVDVSRLLS